MKAYVSHRLSDFLESSPASIVADLHIAYAADGFASQYTSQTLAWEETTTLLQAQLRSVSEEVPSAENWLVLLEIPLYRLRRRIDAIVLTDTLVIVLEFKIGETAFHSSDRRQVEEYALDLRDFHESSAQASIVPVLWATEASSVASYVLPTANAVSDTQLLGKRGLTDFLVHLDSISTDFTPLEREAWLFGVYRPVPAVIEAATTLFAGHTVKEITRADASNLEVAAKRIVEIVDQAKEKGFRALVFLTGVPGSGKTLAGLQVVHDATAKGGDDDGDIVYLSGNTPLVTVLREALAQDEYQRRNSAGERVRIDDIRSSVRARIQHIIDFLREYLSDQEAQPPHEHAIVFDEAQRAWDAKYGYEKFGRTASEPELLLEIMGRHEDWCVLVGLVGGGQEINTGENGMREWGDAIRSLDSSQATRWRLFGPPTVLEGDRSTAFLGLGDVPNGVDVVCDEALRLEVPLRSFRSPLVADWVAAVIDGKREAAATLAANIGDYPIFLTRSLEAARAWLSKMGRGERRYGLVASSGARRLRAEGLGVSLNATDGIKIAHWYLNEPGDVRSSYVLEVTANEYTSQGLELDFIGLCWGGDFLIGQDEDVWECRQFRGNRWNRANGDRRRFIENSYRVLLTRAREGIVIWVPAGDFADHTRAPVELNATASFLSSCGAMELPDDNV